MFSCFLPIPNFLCHTVVHSNFLLYFLLSGRKGFTHWLSFTQTFRRPTSRPPPVRSTSVPQYQRRMPSMVWNMWMAGFLLLLPLDASCYDQTVRSYESCFCCSCLSWMFPFLSLPLYFASSHPTISILPCSILAFIHPHPLIPINNLDPVVVRTSLHRYAFSFCWCWSFKMLDLSFFFLPFLFFSLESRFGYHYSFICWKGFPLSLFFFSLPYHYTNVVAYPPRIMVYLSISTPTQPVVLFNQISP